MSEPDLPEGYDPEERFRVDMPFEDAVRKVLSVNPEDMPNEEEPEQ